MTAPPSESSPAASAGAVVAPSRSSPPRELPGRARIFMLRLPSTPFALPNECACCGEPPSHEVRATDGAGADLLVGYCDACARHVAGSTTRRLALTLAALLVAVALAAALPIAFPWQPAAVTAAIAVLGALLPVLLIVGAGRPQVGHAARGPAVAFRAPRELVCQREAFAERVAERAGVSLSELAKPRVAVRPSWLGIPALTLVLALWSHSYHHPELRILNLTDAPFAVLADGHRVARVEPSSGESPLAGSDVRIPAGRRELRVINLEGGVESEASVRVLPGRRHLYAPLSREACFWLETIVYGREAGTEDIQPLESPERFFVVPEDVQGWFMPTAPAASGSRATGGSARSLRQRPCDDGPPMSAD